MTNILDTLYVDNNKADIELTLEAVKESGIDCHMHIVHDGDHLLLFLSHGEGYANSPRPDLILMDWNMPKTGGLELLAAIKNNLDFSAIPVIIFTGSASEEQVRLAYENNANCYVAKPADSNQYISSMKTIIRFWANVAKIRKKFKYQ